MNKRFLAVSALAAVLVLTVFASGCSKDPNAGLPNPVATIIVEGYGEITVELYKDVAPNTVNNFITLAQAGFYDNLTFHRVVDGFVIQGGDPEGNGSGGPGYNIKGEFSANGVENDITHKAGVISMARQGNPYNDAPYYNTAGSQFFITVADASSSLDRKYAAFGKVTSGMEVVREIAKVGVDENDKPLEDVVIKTITIDTKGGDYSHVEKVKAER